MLKEFPTRTEEVITEDAKVKVPLMERRKKKKRNRKKKGQRWRKSRRSAEIVLLVYRIMAFNNHNNIVNDFWCNVPFLVIILLKGSLHLIHDRRSWQLSERHNSEA